MPSSRKNEEQLHPPYSVTYITQLQLPVQSDPLAEIIVVDEAIQERKMVPVHFMSYFT